MMHSRMAIAAVLATSAMLAAPALGEPRPKRKPKPSKEPLPDGPMTRQQRRAAEREEAKDPCRWDVPDPLNRKPRK